MINSLNKIGICASGVCLLHCLLTPLILIIFPFLETSSPYIDEVFHFLIGLTVLISITISLYPHFQKNGRKDIIALGLFGFSFITYTLIAETESHTNETVITIIGSVLLISAHFKNIRELRNKSCSKASCS